MKQQYLKNVVTLKLDSKKCTGCKMCLNVCPHHVFEVSKGKAKLRDINSCMECGACAKNCESSAITVKPGVGCAAAIIKGILTGSEANCSCSNEECC